MDQKSRSLEKIHSDKKGAIWLAVALISLFSLISYDFDERSTNWLGVVGHSYGLMLTYLFGLTSFFWVGFVGWIGWRLLLKGTITRIKAKISYAALLSFSLSILFNLMEEKGMPIPGALKHKLFFEERKIATPFPRSLVRYNLGGVPLYYLYRDLPLFNLQQLLGDKGICITFSLTSLLSFIFLTDQKLIDLLINYSRRARRSKVPAPVEQNPSPKQRAAPSPSYLRKEAKPSLNSSFTPIKKEGNYRLPPLSLFTSPQKLDPPLLKKQLRTQAEILEESLLSFGIEAKVGDIYSGPTITSFEVVPAVGVKVQKITSLENDIALKLEAKSIRIIAPIPGKAAVGIEIPSPYPQMVSFKEMLQFYQREVSPFQIPMILGQTVTGENIIADLTKMPHCLIAGATGSGKSVSLHAFLASIFMNASPEEIKIILVDPKQVEFTRYNQMPHLITPVITEPHGAHAALNWMVREMRHRYEILKLLGYRDIAAFNERSIDEQLEASLGIPIPAKLPRIVAVVDEFADLKMVSKSDLETPIAQIAQMARAIGIHLVLATQRPSKEVLTGLIKANIPTRIAFKVASRVNSQIILDDIGAESLLGNGDMLVLLPGSSHLLRLQAPFVSEAEINKLISYISHQAAPNYLIPSFDKINPREEEENSSSEDSLYEEARRLVIETHTASTTFLQRKLKIGYARAASIIDALEDAGIISSQEGSKPRRVITQNSNDEKRY